MRRRAAVIRESKGLKGRTFAYAGTALALITCISGATAVPASADVIGPSAVQIATAQNFPTSVRNETFFDRTVIAVEPKKGMATVLAKDPNSSSDWGVDDRIVVDVTRPDGTTITAVDHDFSNGCSGISLVRTLDLTAALQPGRNVLRVRFMDACGGNDGNDDVWISGKGNYQLRPPSLPAMDGGTWINVRGAFSKANGFSGWAEGCTSAFSVSQGVDRFMLTAKHCLDNEKGGNNESKDSAVFASSPLSISTSDDKFYFANNLACVPPNGGPTCVLPDDGLNPGDMSAFKPDAAILTDMVQTKTRLLPVLRPPGDFDAPVAKDLKKNKVTVCHWGNGIHGEDCGLITGIDKKGIVTFDASGFCGDSGGPVYQYVSDGAGNVIGVYAVGVVIEAAVTIDANHVCHVAGHSVKFIPMAMVESGLGVSLVTHPLVL